MDKRINTLDSGISESAVLHLPCKIEQSFIGKDAIIYKDAYIKNSIFHNNTFAGEGSFVEHSTLNEYARVQRYNNITYVNLGKHTYTGRNTTIMHTEIGKFCSIAWNVTIGAPEHNYNLVTSHSFLYYEYDKLNMGEQVYNLFNKFCVIGNDVWIGAGAVILRGVKIGDGAVIGANATVTKEVPPYAIVVGNPASVIKYRFEQKCINKLLDIKWWDLSDEDIRENIEFFSSIPDENTLSNIEKLVRKTKK